MKSISMPAMNMTAAVPKLFIISKNSFEVARFSTCGPIRTPRITSSTAYRQPKPDSNLGQQWREERREQDDENRMGMVHTSPLLRTWIHGFKFEVQF
ncbi:MAG: hypothetical protein WBO95_14555 [Candidatus Dechloromonas phosphoritropha]